MKKYLKTIALLILVAFSSHAWGKIPPISLSTFNMLKESFKTDQKDMVISGLSVDFATDMLANGATGKSLNELTKFLGNSVENKNKELQWKLENLPKTLEISNSIWGNKFKASFKMLLENTLNVSVNPLPNNTDIINAWISDKTHNKIPSVLKPGKTDPYDLYLVNTVYFKDNWSEQFEKTDTKKEKFHSISGVDKEVSMMHKTAKILYAENDKLQSIKLPYKNGGYMTVFLPKENGASIPETAKIFSQKETNNSTDFNTFIGNLTLSDLDLSYTSQKVILSLPKFKIDKKTDVKKLFQSLGITEIFKKNNKDLGAMAPLGAYVQGIIQRTIIEVEEEGTVAAAATVVHTRIRSRRGGGRYEPIIPFTANRPFLFFIDQGDFIGIYTGDK